MAPKPRHGAKTTQKTNRLPSVTRDGSEVAEAMNYTVHLPPTPDNQPIRQNRYRNREEEEGEEDNRLPTQFVSATLFTGGFNSMTRGQLIERMVDSNKVASGTAVFCAVDGCDNSTLDSNENAVSPCYCDFTICRDCYTEAMDAGGVCPGCKEPFHHPSESTTIRLPLPPAPEQNQNCSIERQLSVVQRSGNMHVSHTSTNNRVDFDHVSWLFETKGTYGYGNALWPKDGGRPSYEGETEPGLPIHNKETSRRPLCRKVKVPGAIISPYRLLVVVRLVVLGFFLTWRILHSNKDATWLWGTSIVCELWFAVSWILDQLPKLFPINRATDLNCLRDKFEPLGSDGKLLGISDLPGIDVFVSTADPEKEPPFTTANTVLSILAVDYPAEKLSCYVSDDGGALWTFEALAEAASFARIWVPFCRKHKVEPRNPETYFSLRGDPTKNKVRTDFVRDRRRMKREYDEFKVRINNLRNSIRRRSEAYNAREEMKSRQAQIEHGMDLLQPLEIPPGATWMSDGTHWPGTWTPPSKDHSRQDHAGIIQVMLPPPCSEACYGGLTNVNDENLLDSTGVDIRLPMLVYVSREKRPGYDHNKKAGAMNALVRSSAIMSNGPFILNLDCDHYVYNSTALREGICFMMDRGGDNVCFVQFPQRFEGIDPNDRYANHNTVFFDGNMRALDGLQGPMYVGTGCMFRRSALYGFDPPRFREYGRCFGCCGGRGKNEPGISLVTGGNHDNNIAATSNALDTEDSGELEGAAEEHIKHIQLNETVEVEEGGEDNMERMLLPKMFGSSAAFIASIPVAEFGGRPLAEHPGVRHGRPAGALRVARALLHPATVAEAISVISCWYEHKSEWGNRVGWIYGSVTEDVVTGFRMHNRGWRSIYCVTKRDAFRGTAPINLTDRLHQVLRWATGSVEIFFSRNNGMLAGTRMKILQRVAYLNVGIYPFTSVFLLVYCFLPAVCLFADQFIVQRVDSTFLAYLLAITTCLCLLAILEVKWAGITLEEWWRNEQFWLICGTSAHVAAVLQGLLKVIAGIDISFTLTSKAASEDDEDGLADLYVVKWTSLMIPPITIMMINLISIAVGVARTVYSRNPQWNKLFGGVFFSLWVLVHLYPFAKGLMGRRGRTPTVVWVWSGLLAITISLLWVAITPPSNPLRDGTPATTYNGMIHIP